MGGGVSPLSPVSLPFSQLTDFLVITCYEGCGVALDYLVYITFLSEPSCVRVAVGSGALL